MKHLAAILFCTLLSVAFAAGQGIADTIHHIEPLVIEEGAGPQDAGSTVSRLDESRLSGSAGLSFAELLAVESPLFIKESGRGTKATASFRGTLASHTQVVWNGLTVNNPMLGEVDFSLIPVWFVDEVRLYHGGSSLGVSNGALGGTVALDSRPNWGEGVHGSVAQGMGSFGFDQTFAEISGGGNKLHVKIRAMREKSDNDFKYYNDAIAEPRWTHQQNADYSRKGATADAWWNAGRGNILALNAWFHQNDRNLPSVMYIDLPRQVEKQNDRDVRVALSWQKYTSKLSSELTSGFTYLELDYLYMKDSQQNLTSNVDSRSDIRGFQNKYGLGYDFSDATRLEATLSADYYNARIGNDQWIPAYERRETVRSEYDRFDATLGVRLQHIFSAKWNTFLMLKGDVAAGDWAPLMPSFGVECRPTGRDNLRLKLNVTRNYHRPPLNALYWVPGGNPDLKPEEGHMADLGVEYSGDLYGMRYRVQLTGFYSKMDDLIVWTAGRGNNTLIAENFKKVVSRGLEAALSVQYSTGELDLAVHGNYSFTRSTNERPLRESDVSKGNQLIYVPKHKANIVMNASYRGWYMSWIWSAVSERYVRTDRVEVLKGLPAYDLHNATLGKVLPVWKTKLDIQARVNNIFRRRYESMLWRPMPLNNYSLLIKIAF